MTGHRVVNLWMHGGLLMLAGARMAKSAGNFERVTELADRGIDPLASIRIVRSRANAVPETWGGVIVKSP